MPNPIRGHREPVLSSLIISQANRRPRLAIQPARPMLGNCGEDRRTSATIIDGRNGNKERAMPHASQWVTQMGAVLLVLGCVSGATAQTTKSGTTTSPAAGSSSPPAGESQPAVPSRAMQGRFAAPVGHRQPTRAEIPDADRPQAHVGTGFDDLDAKLRICRGC
jgi:hypothetical protein